MISKENLKIIAKNKVIDSKVLFDAKRYDASVYLIGYAIEVSLKYKICKILKLDKGFPETKDEFQLYILQSTNDLGNEIKTLKEIKNHNLQKLLLYSGQEFKIKDQLFSEWTEILFWHPELRYSNNFCSENQSNKIILSAEKIVDLILK
jgi:HEPN domain-containing protein